jgi:uncharacterized HAD superfamily protein/adenine/guanine phosphoribosyltransferase-like PRPP-binding protein
MPLLLLQVSTDIEQACPSLSWTRKHHWCMPNSGELTLNFRSTADLASTIARNLSKIPRDVDLIVGIPRSGLLAANLLALDLNLPLTHIEGFLAGSIFRSGNTRSNMHSVSCVEDAKHTLVVDDSIYTGATMEAARAQLAKARLSCKMTFAAVYAAPKVAKHVDVYFEVCPMPRMFGWNYMHHPGLLNCCMDIDGVLCCDPSDDENDDGPAYLGFLRSARPLRIPTQEVGYLVTSRLEKYRPETEAWLESHGVHYRKLIMLENCDAETRRRRGLHGRFKAKVYSTLAAELFIESEEAQAVEIVGLSGRPVLCTATQQLVKPKVTSPSFLLRKMTGLKRRLSRQIVRIPMPSLPFSSKKRN